MQPCNEIIGFVKSDSFMVPLLLGDRYLFLFYLGNAGGFQIML